ncbi:Flagellar hook-basal body complex protein FliE [Pseudidiomarina piscicola]|uniref:Flagellar hook-basal body complex protein FliE n=1 Tax=Pseudidiomarina piscicola TaxID=2614830 RepID=A0A6S6WRT2_9GAMM|nr:flagellar hook-basal body complex protein FliE [Pseudidiomarina piscicola]CAB0151056.1 Flagellar hook-basal body complex protein FliE [Pseudidiomarina piscicola]VZT40566.1 Flagellar hook-basal body complex protein FliE [Pseudomonas aeruginosa]
MSVPAIQTALNKMQAMQEQVQTNSVNASQAPQNQGFAAELKQSVEKINELQQTSGAKTTAFQLGDPNVSLSEVMVAKQKAGLAFDMGVQMRNKLVGAYKEIMSMQV